jgi:hypothetical protein
VINKTAPRFSGEPMETIDTMLKEMKRVADRMRL